MDRSTTPVGGDPDRVLQDLATRFSIEATPRTILNKPAHLVGLFKGTRVYVPFLPGADFADTVEACRALIAAGLDPVPHLAARAIPGRGTLDDWTQRLVAEGVQSLFLVGGDLDTPRGPYADASAVLETGVLLDHGLRRIGVAAHPEGHVRASTTDLERALEAKAAYARETGTEMWLVTQFTFSADPILAWLARLEKSGWVLPVWMGVPGPATLPTLTAYALRCGIGASVKALRQRPETALRLLGRWTPDDLVLALAEHHARVPDSPIAGLHVFPFGGIPAAVAWLAEIREDLIQEEMDERTAGLTCQDHGGVS